ncbi:MAG: HD domain-containing protein [Syntrophobacteraceae bacterium]
MQNISESLKKQREIILEESSEQALDRHTSLLEIAIISLYNRLANRLTDGSERFRAGTAIAALGAFGRGVLSPVQAVPILCLQSDDSSPGDSWIEEISEPLVEAGWTVEAVCGSVPQVMHRARTDSNLLFQFLDLRYISGNRNLADKLEKEIDTHIDENRDLLLHTLDGSTAARAKLRESTHNWLEPDIEENPGGLSEIRGIRAGCRIVSSIHSLEDAIFQGYLTRQQVDLLQRAEKAFSRYLTLLRTSSDKPASTLFFRDQEALARKLGYSEKSGFLPVEIFMQQVHQLFFGVAEVANEFWERLEEIRSTRLEDRGEPLEQGMVVRSGKIHIQTDRYQATPAKLVHLFAVAAARRLGLANVTRQWVSHNKNVLEGASGDTSVKDELLQLLRADDPEIPILRRFYDYGLMAAIVPELASAHGLVQHDAFHLYPVQEHHLRTISELKKTIAGYYADTQPELTRLAADMIDPAPLLLAGLLHDIGKSSGSGHAARGGEMIPAIARRLGLSPQEADTVQFLVSQHLLLLDNASLRDLADQEMLSSCATAIGKKEYLDQLVLLTFADMMSTGPRAKEKWRDTPVLPLYSTVSNILEKGEPSSQGISEKIAKVKRQIETRLSDAISPVELETYFSQLAPRYLISFSPEEIVKHLRLGKQLQESREPFIWEVAAGRETAEITIMSWDKPGLLARSAGILTLHNLNILSAQVFTMNNEIALLIFQCRLPEDREPGLKWDAIKRDMDRLVKGKLALDYRIAAHSPQGPVQETLRATPSKIIIDNESSAMYTILEVYTVDRIGLLYRIARTLHELQVLIYVAKITTRSDQVADAFYIRTEKREKVTDPEQISEIERALRFCLDGEAEWN